MKSVFLCFLVSSISFAACTSLTVSTAGVTDLVCNGRDWVSAAPPRWTLFYYTAAVGAVGMGSLLTADLYSSSDLGGGVYEQVASTGGGVPFLNVQISSSISGSTLTQNARVENIHATDKFCPAITTLKVAWDGAITANQGTYRSAQYAGINTNNQVTFIADSTGSIAWAITSYPSNMYLGGTDYTALGSTALAWGEGNNNGGGGWCLDPGEVKNLTLAYKFGSNADTIVSSSATISQQYVTANPSTLADRRPVGAVFLSSTGSRSTDNPRGWISSLTSDLNDPDYETKLASFHTNVLTLTDDVISRVQSAGGQGAVIWDIEGQENDHAASYVCDPRVVDTVAPEMAGVVDAMFAKYRTAGLKSGVCIRPTEFLAQTGAVSGSCSFGIYSTATWSGGMGFKAGMSASVPYATTPYNCKADGNYWPRDAAATLVDPATDRITPASDYYFDNDAVYIGGSPAPGGITGVTVYYVVNKSGGTFQVSEAVGGSPVDITSTGSAVEISQPRDQRNLIYTEALQSLSDKVAYARNRWGTTLYYVDTLFVRSLGQAPSQIFADLNALYPDCVFFPEILTDSEGGEGMWFNSLPYKRSDTYQFFDVPSTFYTASYLAAVSPRYPASFNYYADTPYSGGVFTTNRAAIVNGLAQGSIGVFTSWFGTAWEPVADALTASKTINATLAMTDRGNPRTFQSAPGTSFTYPLTMRVYFAASSGDLLSSTTFCSQLGSTFCFLDGIRQPTAALDLSALPYYQIRYYDFAANLVSEGPYATLQ